MPDLPTVSLGEVVVSRLIVGGNPFSGNSHQSTELSREMRDYYTVERIKATLRECEAQGINTFLGRGDNHIQRMLIEYWNEGGTIQWIAQTAPERGSLPDNIRQIAGTGARCCYVHGGQCDRLVEAGELDPIREAIEVGRKLGLVMGIGGHRPVTHKTAVERELGAQFHCCSFYNLGGDRGETYLPEDRDVMTDLARQLAVPVIGYKIMAAGRNDAEEAFSYAFSHLKPSDAVCVGVFPKHRPNEVRQCADLTRKFGASGT
jgi:hypothetical protein